MLDKLMLEKLIEKELKGLPVFGLSQVERVKKNSVKIKEGLKHEKEVLELSVMLHNAGAKQCLQFTQDFIQYSVALAKKFLSRANYPSKKMDSIIHCIQEAHLNGQPKTIEAKILHDAVLLDEISAIGILKDSISFYSQKKSLQNFRESLRAKSYHLKNAFYTEKGKESAREGIAFYNAFVERLEREL